MLRTRCRLAACLCGATCDEANPDLDPSGLDDRRGSLGSLRRRRRRLADVDLVADVHGGTGARDGRRDGGVPRGESGGISGSLTLAGGGCIAVARFGTRPRPGPGPRAGRQRGPRKAALQRPAELGAVV
jgi:hypothetical protein